MTAAATDPTVLLKGVARLSVGSIVLQASGALSQILFAVWLSPAHFGAWAAATSSMMIFSGLVNFGEVNGFLTHAEKTYRATRNTIWRLNLALALSSLVVAIAYLAGGQPDVAILVILIGFNLPLMGHANLLYAAQVKRGAHGSIVHAQLISAALRAGIGIAVAWAFESAVAFAVSMIIYSVTMILMLSGSASRNESQGAATRSSTRDRIAWSVQSLSQTVPTQIDFFVVSLLATPVLLGIYFLSYQATVALSSLVIPALIASVLSSVSQLERNRRSAYAARLIVLATTLLGLAVSVIVPIIQIAAPLLPPDWAQAAPTIAILLSSVPARFLIPLTDSVLMADWRWWTSVRMNLVDAIGTGAVATLALTGDVMTLAIGVAMWKVIYALARTWLCLGGLSIGRRLTVILPPAVLAASLIATVRLGNPSLNWMPIALAVAICLSQLAGSRLLRGK